MGCCTAAPPLGRSCKWESRATDTCATPAAPRLAEFAHGAEFSGLGTLDNAVTPEQANVGVAGQANSITYALVLTLNRS